MSDTPHSQFPPIAIGDLADPAKAILPAPATLFSHRAARARALAPNHQLDSYLRFLAGLADAQAALVETLPAATPLPADHLARAREFGMPPISRATFGRDRAALATVDALLARLADLDMPESARAARDRVAALSDDGRLALIAAVLDDAIPVEAMADQIFVAASLQVTFAAMAATLDAKNLELIGDGICPSCGAPPATSAIVGWAGAVGARFCACPLCATNWHVVRIKCVSCSSTKGIHYQSLKGLDDPIKAECCDECRTYVKIFRQDLEPDIDPLIDDVASLGIDLLVRETGFARAGVNPFLLGF